MLKTQAIPITMSPPSCDRRVNLPHANIESKCYHLLTPNLGNNLMQVTIVHVSVKPEHIDDFIEASRQNTKRKQCLLAFLWALYTQAISEDIAITETPPYLWLDCQNSTLSSLAVNQERLGIAQCCCHCERTRLSRIV